MQIEKENQVAVVPEIAPLPDSTPITTHKTPVPCAGLRYKSEGGALILRSRWAFLSHRRAAIRRMPLTAPGAMVSLRIH
jgi:hypothetical protein